ncbi:MULTISPECIES: hypothetical protein [Brucella]|uniref:hypothetical protein n=1 Tax=Brucella TaxID=234 RepID=UPI00116039B2|nr:MULTISPECIES: hypothetical protein [Brucella]MDH0582993.1 hypothetical protein [Brucella anthropi]MDH0819609.1 hypothetical protein [Brucella anthropi]MDH2086251.1 hypothetical protein [Brucella anthropi]
MTCERFHAVVVGKVPYSQSGCDAAQRSGEVLHRALADVAKRRVDASDTFIRRLLHSVRPRGKLSTLPIDSVLQALEIG